MMIENPTPYSAQTFNAFLFKTLIPVIAFVFIIIHGLYGDIFKIDEITLWLLVIILVPFLSSYLSSLKVGDLELNFKSLPKENQMLVFLKSIAQHTHITFYTPREDESELGIIGKHLVKELNKTNPAKLHEELHNWIKSPEAGMKWLASEIIGYFGIKTFSDTLYNYYDCEDITNDWENWKLNYLWAHSKIDNNYEELNQFLFTTKSDHNRVWLLDVYLQMSNEDNTLKSVFLESAQQLARQNSLSEKLTDKVKTVITHLQSNS